MNTQYGGNCIKSSKLTWELIIGELVISIAKSLLNDAK